MVKQKAPAVLSALSELPEAMISELFAEAVARNLEDGQALFRAGDAGDGCYRLKTGLVNVVVASQLGEERIISLLGPHALVGELAMIDGGPRSASVVAISDCSLLFVSRDKFEKYVEAHPEITGYLVRTLARRLRQADEALAAATFLSVRARLARALLNLAEHVGQATGGNQIELRLKISQGDLAAMAGIARENVSRTMSEWRKRGLVTRPCDYYCIKDARALAQEV
jgi:CRP/FNR family transcriptional regulator, cyclic AMP receptor protein